MLLSLTIIIPIAAGVLALLIRDDSARRFVLPVTAVAHTGLVISAWVSTPGPEWNGWLTLDALGLLFLSITSLLFLVASVYCVGYLGAEAKGHREDFIEKQIFTNAPQAIFVSCLLFFLSAMTIICAARHFGLIWVAIEATTLVSAPLIYFHRHRRSLEATWKYLIICSVGIAIALMGYMLLAISASTPTGGEVPLMLPDLLANAKTLSTPWLKAAFILFVVGYGTKVGLAPLHTWLPDAHSEAPSVVSALLSGALLNCAFLGILRALQVCAAAGIGQFAREILIFFGLFSMAIAAVFIIGQRDFKRMLAYSSVEHMGIISLGVGMGGSAVFGAMLHAVNHSLTKCMLFLLAGNILAAYKTKVSADVRGIMKSLPVSGPLWLLGFFAITGAPPFGVFISEFTILKGALEGGFRLESALYLAFLAIIFVGMAGAFLAMSRGVPAGEPGVNLPTAQAAASRENPAVVIPPLALAMLITTLGLYVPLPLQAVLRQAAEALGGV